MINVYHVINNLRIGGAQQLVLDICRRLDRTRFRLKVVALESDAQPIGEEIATTGIEVAILRAKPGSTALWELPALARELKGADIVHSHLFNANLLARVAGPLAGCRHYLCHEHSCYPQKERLWRLPVRLERLLARHTDRIVCISQAVHDYAIRQSGLPERIFCTLPNGIDVGRYAEARRDPQLRSRWCRPERLLAITVGTLTAAKDQETMLRGFAVAVENGLDAELLVVGAGPLLQRLQTLATERGVDDRVHFAGARRDIPSLLAQADLFATSSVREGQGLAAMEALAAGLPVLATRVDGLPEVVTPEVGVLVPPRDATEFALGLAQVARLTQEGAFQREQLIGIARQRHDIAGYCERVAALYESIVRGDQC